MVLQRWDRRLMVMIICAPPRPPSSLGNSGHGPQQHPAGTKHTTTPERGVLSLVAHRARGASRRATRARARPPRAAAPRRLQPPGEEESKGRLGQRCRLDPRFGQRRVHGWVRRGWRILRGRSAWPLRCAVRSAMPLAHRVLELLLAAKVPLREDTRAAQEGVVASDERVLALEEGVLACAPGGCGWHSR